MRGGSASTHGSKARGAGAGEVLDGREEGSCNHRGHKWAKPALWSEQSSRNHTHSLPLLPFTQTVESVICCIRSSGVKRSVKRGCGHA